MFRKKYEGFKKEEFKKTSERVLSDEYEEKHEGTLSTIRGLSEKDARLKLLKKCKGKEYEYTAYMNYLESELKMILDTINEETIKHYVLAQQVCDIKEKLDYVIKGDGLNKEEEKRRIKLIKKIKDGIDIINTKIEELRFQEKKERDSMSIETMFESEKQDKYDFNDNIYTYLSASTINENFKKNLKYIKEHYREFVGDYIDDDVMYMIDYKLEEISYLEKHQDESDYDLFSFESFERVVNRINQGDKEVSPMLARVIVDRFIDNEFDIIFDENITYTSEQAELCKRRIVFIRKVFNKNIFKKYGEFNDVLKDLESSIDKTKKS